jgi:mono/diheme cytochrome c family protein
MSTLKKLAKRAGIALGGLVAVAAGLAAYVEIDGVPRYEAKPPDLHVAITPERVARGQKLATLICADCHENDRTHVLTGKHLAEMPKEFGVVFSKNITRHPEKGIGRWTDGEIAYLLRTGVRRDGQYVPPWMPKFPNMSDEDLASIIAFLRSDDPRVAAADVDPAGTTRPSFLGKALTHTVMKPLPFPAKAIPEPDKKDRVAYGRYLAVTLDCWTCHSADFKTMNVMEPEKTPGYFGGGNTVGGVDHAPITTANLTPDDETGIGRWTEADFVRAVRSGFRPDGRVLRYPMLPKPDLDEDEVSAIYSYLRTVPRIRNAVPRPDGAARASDHPGKKVYVKYGCVGCHGDTGVGLGGIADLRQANERYPADVELRAWIEDAPSKKPGTRMPKWKGIIAEEDYAPLMAHVRALSSASSREASNR